MQNTTSKAIKNSFLVWKLYFIGQGIFEPKTVDYFSNFTDFFQNYWPNIEKIAHKN